MPERDRSEEQQLISEEEFARALRQVGGDADTPEEKDEAWDLLTRHDDRQRREIDRLVSEADTAERDLGEARKALEQIAALPCRMHPIAGYMYDEKPHEIARAFLASLPDTDSEPGP